MRPEEQLRRLRDPNRWIDAEWPAPPRSAPRRRFDLVSVIATAAVLLLIAGVTYGLTNLPHAPVAAGPTSSASASTTHAGTIHPKKLHCAEHGDGFAPFPCNTFVAVKGASSSDLSWLSSGKFTIAFRYMNGAPSVLISTPCNGGTVPVAVSSTKLEPVGSLITSAMLCTGARGTEERFAYGLFAKPVIYGQDGAAMHLKQGDTTVFFRAKGALEVPSEPGTVTSWDPALTQAPQTWSLTAKGLPGCRLADLTTWGQSDGGGAAGTYYQGVFIRNDGPTCSLLHGHLRAVLGDGRVTVAVSAQISGGPLVLPTGVSERLMLTHATGGCMTFTKERLPIELQDGTTTRKIDATYPAPTTDCDTYGFAPETIAARSDFTVAGYPNALPHLSVTAHQPAQDFHGGTRLYTITIKNTGTTAYNPATCPRYVQVDVGPKSVTAETGTLDCRDSGPIPAGGERTFAMRMTAPTGQDYESEGWYLIGGSGDSWVG